MAKNKGNLLIIDLDVWTTQVERSRLRNEKLSTISQRVKRTKEGKTDSPINILDIPALGITLVER